MLGPDLEGVRRAAGVPGVGLFAGLEARQQGSDERVVVIEERGLPAFSRVKRDQEAGAAVVPLRVELHLSLVDELAEREIQALGRQLRALEQLLSVERALAIDEDRQQV